MSYSFFDWLFPKTCFGCGVKGGYLCQSCVKKIVLPRFQRCPVCYKVSFTGITHPGCRKKYFPDGLLTLFAYRPPLSSILKQFKFNQVRELKETLTGLACGRLKVLSLLTCWQRDKFIFLSIPLYWSRFRWRGFDQSELILKEMADNLSLLVDNYLLKRKKWTKVQSKLESEERKENLKDAFLVTNPLQVKGKNFVIFDDVVTTGSTLKEACKALKVAGAKKVWCLALMG